MKMTFSILTGLLFLLFSLNVNGQDLIDRTKMNISLDEEIQANSIAKNIEIERNSQTFPEISFFDFSQKKEADRYEAYLHDAVFFDLKPTDLQAVFKSRPANMLLQIPVAHKKSFELELMQVEVLTPDFVLKTSDGRQFTADEIPILFYRGIVKGNPNSTATITIVENEVKGLITDRDGNYVIAPISGKSGRYTLYNDANLVAENTFQCGSEDDAMSIGRDVTQSTDNASNRLAECVEVYVECDQHTYQSNGSNVENVQAFVGSLFSEVTTLYANENINISLSEVFVWTTPDPYASINSTSNILEEFGNVRRNDYSGRLAHLISTRSLGGGIAWLDVLCYNYFSFNADWNGDGVAELHHAGPYAVSAGLSTLVTPIPTYSWNVNVFAHEMGHNFGSSHTQKCVWGAGQNQALDNCVLTEGFCSPGPVPTNGGTIMSYCHLTPFGINLNNGFGDEPGDLIRNNYNNANCNLTCESIVLPIDLLSFSAKESDAQTALLTWSTGTELDGSHFEIERQTNAKEWEMIGKVAAIGYTETNWYKFEDKKPTNGENLYRLKQVDTNGDYVYSQVEVLTFKGQQHIVFNNPFNDVLHIRIQTEQEKTLQVSMFDAQGKLVEQRLIEVQKGFNTTDWDIEYLPKGIYFMQVADGQQEMFKLIKM